VSALLFNQVQHLRAEIKHLQDAVERLAARVIDLEVYRPSGVELDLHTLEPKRRGRPPKVTHDE
jgi:hypothetical protein